MSEIKRSPEHQLPAETPEDGELKMLVTSSLARLEVLKDRLSPSEIDQLRFMRKVNNISVALRAGLDIQPSLPRPNLPNRRDLISGSQDRLAAFKSMVDEAAATAAERIADAKQSGADKANRLKDRVEEKLFPDTQADPMTDVPY